jgi:hypothetical protein
VIFVGIAFGMNEKKQAIGDILLAKQLRLYEDDAVIPNLCHVANLVAIELHHIDIVRLDSVSGGWY